DVKLPRRPAAGFGRCAFRVDHLWGAVGLGSDGGIRPEQGCADAVIQVNRGIHRPPQAETDALALAADERRCPGAFAIHDLDAVKAHPMLVEDTLAVWWGLIQAEQAFRRADETPGDTAIFQR